MEYILSDQMLTINDSYRVTVVSTMLIILSEIRLENAEKEFSVLQRTDGNLVNEWCAHNLLYNLGIKRDRTATVDMEYPQSKWHQVAYWVLGNIYKIFH